MDISRQSLAHGEITTKSAHDGQFDQSADIKEYDQRPHQEEIAVCLSFQGNCIHPPSYIADLQKCNLSCLLHLWLRFSQLE
jgi:hypothetical protein